MSPTDERLCACPQRPPLTDLPACTPTSLSLIEADSAYQRLLQAHRGVARVRVKRLIRAVRGLSFSSYLPRP